MDQTSLDPKNGAQSPGASEPGAAAGTGATTARAASAPGAAQAGATASGAAQTGATQAGATQAGAPAGVVTPEYEAVLGPFTIRDLTVFGSTLLVFIGSLLPMFAGTYNLWNLNNLFFLALGIILPLVVTALFVARRLQPANVVRIGSLSIDQFASVVASFAATLFFLTTAGAFTPYVLVSLVGSAGLLVATVFAPHLPVLREDFKGRTEQPAHVVAREAAVPTRKPVVPKPTAPKAGEQKHGEHKHAEQKHAELKHAELKHAEHKPVASRLGLFGSGAKSTTPDAPVPVVSAPSAAETSASVAAGSAKGTEAPQPQAHPSPESANDAQAVGEHGHLAATMATPLITSSVTAPPATQHIERVGQANAGPAAEGQVNQAHMNPAEPNPADTSPAEPKVRQTIGATVDPATRMDESEHGSGYEAFWFAVAQPRAAVDERTGTTVFRIEPGTWVLALEDRGDEFLVQDSDGKVGVLRDISNVERG
ncbi:hypothetical protein AB6813_02800 [bacterium RCC_150]